MPQIIAKRIASAPASQQRADTFAYDRMECEALPSALGETVSMELIPMQQATREMPFLAYRKFVIENKVRAFRVPMSKAGINQNGRLGDSAGREETETFKAEVVEPQQTMVEHMFDSVLRDDFATDLRFRFKELDLRDTAQIAETAARLVGNEPILTVDEGRAMLGYPAAEANLPQRLVGNEPILTVDEGRAMLGYPASGG